MHFHRWTHGILALSLVFAGSGCGGKQKVVKVTGVVTLDGAPLAGATVTFVNAKQGRPAWGLTNSSGEFELTTFNTRDGALPGEYKVTVRLEPSLESGQNAGAMDPKDPKSMIQYQLNRSHKMIQGGPGGVVQEKSPIHANYMNAERTPLQQVVPPAGLVEVKLRKDGT